MNKKISSLIKSIDKFADNSFRISSLNAQIDVLINAESIISKISPDFNLAKSPSLSEIKSMLSITNITNEQLNLINKIVSNCFKKVYYIKKNLNGMTEIAG
tara:strand:- start:7062 stop:7364 length:303 start_codon:yes stop_codon:yes gene_type:complete